MGDKPNIILFITHDQGQFIGCYDSPTNPNSLKTPYLDKLAADGVKFNNHFCTAPQCSPSRGSILTSLYPHQNGLMGLVNLGWDLPNINKTLPMYLKENGYSTHLLGLQHEHRNAMSLGYEYITNRRNPQMYSCNQLQNKFIEFLNNHKKDDKPFYACFGVFETHRPYHGWGDYVDPESVEVPPYLPDNQIIRQDIADYYGTIQVVDKTIGTIIDHLESTDLREKTLFIFTTDHGEPLPRAKCTLYDPGIKTSLIMNLPNSEKIKPNSVMNSMVSNIDLLPSLLDIIGAEIPKDIEGKSFLSHLIAEDAEFRKEIFTEKTFHEWYDPLRSIRTNKYKYIKNFEKLETLYQIDLFASRYPIGQHMEYQIKKPRPDEELYDLKEDPTETNNLATNFEYSDIMKDLKTRLYNWMKSTNDPILKGRVVDNRKDPPKRF